MLRLLPRRQPLLHALCSYSGSTSAVVDSELIDRYSVTEQSTVGRIPISYAAAHSTPGTVQKLLEESKPHLCDGDRHGQTPLHYACGTHAKPGAQTKIPGMLLAAAPEAANARNQFGVIPIHALTSGGECDLDVLAMLLDANPPSALDVAQTEQASKRKNPLTSVWEKRQKRCSEKF